MRADQRLRRDPEPGAPVTVLLDRGLAWAAGDLRAQLGAGFSVVVWPPRGEIVAVVDAMTDGASDATIARTQAWSMPARILAVAGGGAEGWRQAVALLDAGADDVLVELSTLELAARLRALARRQGRLAAGVQ